MNHYLRNGGCYFLDSSGGNVLYTEKYLSESKKDYALFVSVIERIDRLDDQKKKSFLQNMRIHHDTDNTEPTENVIVVMDRILL